MTVTIWTIGHRVHPIDRFLHHHRFLARAGHAVVHILPDGRLRPHALKSAPE